MTTVEQFLDALAQVESANNPEAWGDGGRAMGRWQVHPARLFDEARRYDLFPTNTETWDQFVKRVLIRIYNHYATRIEARTIAMYWHLGHWVQPGEWGWDIQYEQKFNDAMARALGQAIT